MALQDGGLFVINILSLGAGVQSTTMALMAAHGEITPMPDYAIFADTGAEPWHVYDQLDFLEEVLPFPVLRVMEHDGLHKNIFSALKDGKDSKGRYASAPFFTESKTGRGMLRRQCTSEFKIKPIERKVRQLLGLKKGQRAPKEIAVSMWVGISADEAQRMKPNQKHYIQNRWPLIEKEMYRWGCLQWMEKHGYELPKKSACYFCPYHDDKTWLDIKQNDPDAWDDAVKMDEMIRGGVHKTKQKLFLHSSLTPLADVDLDPDRDQVDMFGNECEGMCGV